MGLFKLLLTGEVDEQDLNRFATADERALDVSLADEFAADRFAQASDGFPIPFASGESRENSDESRERLQALFARDIAVAKERDELRVRVGRLHLAVESLLRLLQEKTIITDQDLLRMTRQVDVEGSRDYCELHGDEPAVNPVNDVPDHCPKCEAKISTGKHMCVLCGHSFKEPFTMSHA